MINSAITAVFGADTAPLQNDAKKAEGIVEKLTSNAKSLMTGLGAALGAGAVIGWFSGVVEAAGRVQDLSDNLGVSTDAVQGFNFAVTQSGGTLEDASKILATARLKLDELASGNTAAEKSFAALHLKASDFKGLSLEQSIEKIARASATYGNEAGAAAAANDILGKSGSRLNSVIEQLGRDGFQKLTEDAKKMGQVIESDTIAKLDELGDNMAKLKGASTTLGAWVLGSALSLTEGLGKVAATVVNAFDGIPTVQEDIARKAEKVATAQDTVTVAIRGTVVSTDELAKLKQAEAKKSEEAALASMTSLEKIAHWETKLVQLGAERAKFDKDTKEALALQAQHGDVVNKIAAERNRLVEETKKREEQLARARQLDREHQIELIRLESVGSSSLTAAERIRLEQLRTMAREKRVGVEIDEILKKGAEKLTAEEKEKLVQLIRQDDKLKEQIAKQTKLIEGAIAKVKSEADSAVTLGVQTGILEESVAKTAELVALEEKLGRVRAGNSSGDKKKEPKIESFFSVKEGREDSQLSDRELEEKVRTMAAEVEQRRIAVQSRADGLLFDWVNTGDRLNAPEQYDRLLSFARMNLEAAKTEQARRDAFRRDFGLYGEGAFARYSAFDEQTLRNYIRPEDERRAQQSLAALESINRRMGQLLGVGG